MKSFSCDGFKDMYLCKHFCIVIGTVVDTDGNIKLEDLPIVTPNGDVVVPSLSFQVSAANYSHPNFSLPNISTSLCL